MKHVFLSLYCYVSCLFSLSYTKNGKIKNLKAKSIFTRLLTKKEKRNCKKNEKQEHVKEYKTLKNSIEFNVALQTAYTLIHIRIFFFSYIMCYKYSLQQQFNFIYFLYFLYNKTSTNEKNDFLHHVASSYFMILMLFLELFFSRNHFFLTFFSIFFLMVIKCSILFNFIEIHVT